MTPPKINIERREVLRVFGLCGLGVLAGGVTLGSYVIAPALEQGKGRWLEIANMDDLEPDQMQMLGFEFMVKDGWKSLPQRGFVWARKETGDKVTIFSSTCTHLACNVVWNQDENAFLCPCHSGRFDRNGQPVAGPPSRPLTVLEHKVEDGSLLVYMTA
jgi:Rieske Fe-S protein